jgi:hypothetical protein
LHRQGIGVRPHSRVPCEGITVRGDTDDMCAKGGIAGDIGLE